MFTRAVFGTLLLFAALDVVRADEIRSQDVPKLIRELDDSSFRLREEATSKLKTGGMAIVEPLLTEINKDCSPEVRRRAFEILTAASASEDEAQSQAAVAGLTRLTQSKNVEIALTAKRSLSNYIEKLRQLRIETIRRMGGDIGTVGADLSGGSFAVPEVVELPEDLVDQFDKALAGERTVSKRAEEIAAELSLGEDKALPDGRETKKEPPTRVTFAPRISAIPEGIELEVELLETVDFVPVVFPSASLPSSTTTHGPMTVTIGPDWTGGDDGLSDLVKLDAIESVTLRDVKLSSDAVRHLVQLKGLKNLQIFKGSIEPAAFRALRKVRPDVYVFGTGEGYLGVNGSGGSEDGFRVTRASGGAKAAGIRDGDVIASLNGIPVKDLSDVSLFVFNRKSGYPFRAEVIRDGKRIQLEGKIGTR